MRIVRVMAVRGVPMLGMGTVSGSDRPLFQARRRPLAGAARARAHECNQPGQNGAEQG